MLAVCACGRNAIDVTPVATEDGLLLVAVCAECVDDPLCAEQHDLFPPPHGRRPLASMSARTVEQPSLPLDDANGEERGAA